jgi:dTDP-4-dehydrorhamnose reductase
MRSVLITGASGFVGENLAHRFKEDCSLYLAYGLQRPRAKADEVFSVDLGVRDDFSRVLGDLNVDTVVHAAAIGSPGLCEEDPSMAHAVNVEGTQEVARWAEARGAGMIYFSTDLVFDGKKGLYEEEDAPGPLNVYARTKLDAEGEVARICTQWVIVRLALSYGPTRGAGGDWTLALRRTLEQGRTLRLFTDQYRSPAYVGDTVEAVFRLARAGKTGVFHVGGGDRVNRYEFGQAFCHIFGLARERFVPVRMEEVRMDAPAPPDCSLNTDKLAREIGLVTCGVEQGLRRQKLEEQALAQGKGGGAPARDPGA